MRAPDDTTALSSTVLGFAMPVNDPIRNTRITPADVLDLIADGLSYEQIIARFPDLSYKDIFEASSLGAKTLRAVRQTASPAAAELVCRDQIGQAIDRSRHNRQPPKYNVATIRRKYPRAYERWTDEEDHQLAEEHQAGYSIRQIARAHGRQTGAIRSRLDKLRESSQLTYSSDSGPIRRSVSIRTRIAQFFVTRWSSMRARDDTTALHDERQQERETS